MNRVCEKRKTEGARQKGIGNSGQIAIEFLLAFVMFVPLFVGTFLFGVALVFTEYVQYVAYVSSRAYYASDKDMTKQHDNGVAIFDHAKGTFKDMGGIGESIYERIERDGPRDFNDDDAFIDEMTGGHEPYPNVAVNKLYNGIRITFPLGGIIPGIPYISEGMEIPPVTVDSFLGREPSRDECLRFFRQMPQAMSDLMTSGNGVSGSSELLMHMKLGEIEGQSYLSDNGC